MKNMKKILVLALAAVLLVAASVAGTLAYLFDTTTPVENTFTTAGIDIELTETWNAKSNDAVTDNDHWTARLIPGVEYDKDPIVSVIRPETDVEIYLFVKIEKTANLDDLITYTSNLTGWTELVTGSGIYYRTVAADEEAGCGDEDCRAKENPHWHLLTGDKVTVKATLTGADIPDDGTAVNITYTAYACQTATFDDAADAWESGLGQTLPTAP